MARIWGLRVVRYVEAARQARRLKHKIRSHDNLDVLKNSILGTGREILAPSFNRLDVGRK